MLLRSLQFLSYLSSQAMAYALSPIDLIPDFIPILGVLDDLVIVPGLIWLALMFIPKDVSPPSVLLR